MLRLQVGKFASSGGPTARADGSNSTTERGWVHGGRLGGQERRWEKGKKTKKKSHRQLAMEARAKHKESIASIWDDVDPTRDPELEFWYEREKHDNITLPGMRSYEEIVADSDWHKLIRKAHEIEHAKEVTSWAEIEECWSNGTYFRLPEGLKRYVDSVHEEGAVSHVFPLGYSEPGQDLIKAAQTNNVSAVRELLDEGANPDYQDWAGQTALHVASLFGHVEVVNTLLDRGAAPSIANWCNYTALDYALWSQYPINVTFVGCDYDYPAPCRDKTLRRKVKAALREAGAYNGWGKNWEWAAEVERRGLLEQFDSYVHRMPLDLLQALVDCNIVRRGDVSHRFPSSIHSGVSPWIDAARQAGIDVPTTYAYEMVDDEKLAEWGMAASGETAEAGGGGGGGSGGTPTVADFLHRLRTAPFATDSEEPDDPTTSE